MDDEYDSSHLTWQDVASTVRIKITSFCADVLNHIVIETCCIFKKPFYLQPLKEWQIITESGDF